MNGYLIRLAATGVTFVITAALVPQILLPATGMKDPVRDIFTIALIAVVFGAVNGLIRPVVRTLALPLRLMTFGLVGIVINAALLLLVAWLATKAGFQFHIGNFPPNLLTADTLIGALIGSVVLGVVGGLVSVAVRD